MSNNKLSHSSISRFLTCPKSYEYHYIKKYTSKYKSGALYFGTAIDAGLETLLKTKDVAGAKFQFDRNWITQKDNSGATIDLQENENITYAKKDFDYDLLQKSDWARLFKLRANPLDEKSRILSDKENIGWDNLDPEDRKFYNLMNWLCLRRKGHMMIDAYNTDILPNIKEVLGTQVLVELKNPDGDLVKGFVDLVARWKDDTIIVLDNKTSAIEYEHDSVIKSPQLGLYTIILNDYANRAEETGWKYHVEKAGFLVLRKGLEKDILKVCKSCGFTADSTHKTCNNEINGTRCGGAWDRSVKMKIPTQIIIDKVPERMLELLLENLNVINKSIKSNLFPRNFSSCEMPWGKCDFYDLCHHKSMKNIVSREEKKNDESK